MPMRFHATDTQTVLGPVVMLPQAESTTGGSKRPLNSYAVLREGRSILFDAPVSWAMEGIERLAAEGHPPDRSPGSVMLHAEDEGGILLAGDCAVGPGPEQADWTPRLERPIMADEDPRFLDGWRALVERLPLVAVLPLHGEAYLRREHAQDFDGIVATIWTGAPMKPRRPRANRPTAPARRRSSSWGR